MKLRTKYIVFVVLLHMVVLVLSYFIFSENKLLFLAAEMIVVVTVIISWQLYRELIQPLQLLLRGTDAIKDKDFSVKLVPTGRHELDQLIGVYNRMMDELRTERTRQQMQHFFLEKLIHSSPTGILILDYDENVQQVNPKALQLLELEEKQVKGKSTETLLHPVIQQIRTLQSGQSKTFTYLTNTYKLQKSHFIDQGFPRHFIMIEELTAEILAAEKKTYGNVIRMMAHEVNNTIGPVNSIIQSVLQSRQHAGVLSNAMQVAMERNHNLNGFMRNFASLVQIPAPVKKPVDLNLLLQNIIALLQWKAAEIHVTIHDQLSSSTLMVMADLQQMEQVIVNIIKNAMEAMEVEGVITIITHSCPKQLIIRDTGKGISAESEQQLFSPFYSTKKDGQGIGLTVIREILTNHNFNFSLRTIRQGVTEFVVNF